MVPCSEESVPVSGDSGAGLRRLPRSRAAGRCRCRLGAATMMIPRLDKTAMTITSLDAADKADRAYWHGQTSEKRLQAMQWLRELNYGRDAVSGRLSRLLEITRRE